MSVERVNQLKKDQSKISSVIPDVMKSFHSLHNSVLKDSNLTAREKMLIALGIVISKQCADCIAYNLKSAIDMGITFEEVMEVCGVSILMSGGPGIAYSCLTVELFEEYKKNM